MTVRKVRPILDDEATPPVDERENATVVAAALRGDRQEASNKVASGQRRINLIWEVSQSAIALMVTCAIVVAALTDRSSLELSNAFFLIIGFYFSRTNHEREGGVRENQSGR